MKNTATAGGRLIRGSLLALTLNVAGMAPGTTVAQAQASRAVAQQSFPTPDDAVAALVKATEAGDPTALRAVLGNGSEKLIASGDPVADTNARRMFLDFYATGHALEPHGDRQMMLVIGRDAWPLPIPLVSRNGRWRFDAIAGAQEIVDRRVGRNELLTIQTLLAGVAAQKDYFDRAKLATGVGRYASSIMSTPGAQDGLYWDARAGETPSPLDSLIASAQDEGYPGAKKADGKPIPFRGYFFRILSSQGPNAPGGARSYEQSGKLTDGFAFIAWPADYGSSGIVTFLIDADGIVFQKDLGPATARIAGGMASFDPDLTWARVDVGD